MRFCPAIQNTDITIAGKNTTQAFAVVLQVHNNSKFVDLLFSQTIIQYLTVSHGEQFYNPCKMIVY